MNHTLSWGLIVATYQREQILPQCLKLAVEQTRKPTEIIVIDASDNWESTRDKVMSEIATTAPDIRWIYTAANQRGLPLQRNQGLDLATADILFFLDDDSLMYPDCAEEILKVYEADSDGVVVGVQAALVDALPSDVVVEDEQKPVGWKIEQWIPGVVKLQRFVWKHIFLMNNEVLCVPYYGDFPSYSVPQPLLDLNAQFMRIFHGCRMTFRRDAIAKERFEPLLLYYALNEDMDASYRVSSHGLLLEAANAKLHHFQSNSGRLSRFVVTALSALNQAVCVRRYSNDLKRDRTRFYILTSRRVLAEFFKDGLSRRWTFPQLRGILTAFRYAPAIFSLPEHELADWYPQLQKEFVVQGKPPILSKDWSIQTAPVRG
ncbi:MAG: glycosyltransferase family 2 protein [Oscillatoriales cyanobacterium C42_A2020_001]|nr:glycosyltransferase family 2 protein [Leptolyngbyaceae cyanobacterium C42_A2020_001]